MSKSGFFWNDKKSRFSLITEQRFKNTNSRPIMIEEVSQNLNGITESQRGEIYRAHQGDEEHRRDQQLLHEQLLEQNRDLRETQIKSLHEMQELNRVQELRIDEFSRRRLVEDQDYK